MNMLRMTALGAVTALSITAVQAQTVPEGYPAEYAQLLEDAAAEGELLIYTNMEAVQWEGAVELLQALVPGIDVQLLELTSGEIAPRYAAEVAAGLPTADLLVTTDVASWVDMVANDQIMPYDSPEAAIFPEWSKPHPGLYTIAADPMMFMWNKALLPEDLVPTSFADLVAKVEANPDVFRNKLTTYDPTTPYGYNAHFAFVRFHGEKAWDWLDVLSPMTRPDGTGPMIEKVTSGEYILSYFMGAGAAKLALRDPARAALLGLGPISDGNPIVLRGTAIPNGAAHPNAAKAMIDVLLSKPGQISLGLRARTPIRPDVTTEDVEGGLTYAEVVSSIGEENMIPITFDAELASDESFDTFGARYAQGSGK